MNALLALMEKQEFNKITITELCKKAGVTRLTFTAILKVKKMYFRIIFIKSFKSSFRNVFLTVPIRSQKLGPMF